MSKLGCLQLCVCVRLCVRAFARECAHEHLANDAVAHVARDEFERNHEGRGDDCPPQDLHRQLWVVAI
jgi:hypothetical protein